MDLKGKTALVTGASSGIGMCIARRLAERGADLVITARRSDRLEALAAEIEAAHGVRVTSVPLDLAEPGAPARLFDATEGSGRVIDVLVNNAGFGTQEHFVDIPWAKTAEQLQLNVVSLTELSWLFAKPMKARARGWILNVASIGAYMPVPSFATYAAGKAYVRNFTEALAFELSSAGVRVCCLCPGGTKTEFMEVAGQELTPQVRLTLMSADRCARIGLSALFGWRRNIVAGFMNSLMMLSTRFVPRRLLVAVAALVMAKR